jgi:hypothetical protein
MIIASPKTVTQEDLEKQGYIVHRLITDSHERVWKVTEGKKMTEVKKENSVASAKTVVEESNKLVSTMDGGKEVIASATSLIGLLLSTVQEQIKTNNDKVLVSIANIETKLEESKTEDSKLTKRLDEIDKNVMGLKAIMALIKDAIKN